jgi:hypothetical protein
MYLSMHLQSLIQSLAITKWTLLKYYCETMKTVHNFEKQTTEGDTRKQQGIIYSTFRILTYPIMNKNKTLANIKTRNGTFASTCSLIKA